MRICSAIQKRTNNKRIKYFGRSENFVAEPLAIGDQSGSGKAAGEDGQEEKGNQMSKDEGGWNSSFSEKPVHHRPRILEAGLTLTDVREVHLVVAFLYISGHVSS